MTQIARAAVRFADLRFDPLRLQLTRGGTRLALRPKPAALLALLLARRERIVSKGEIAAAVWGGRFVADQTVFQTVSELRKALAPLDAVVTHPNLGYQFALPVRRDRVRLTAAAAALVVASMACACIVALAPGTRVVASRGAVAPLPPALAALQNGLSLLAQQDPVAAEQWFRLALRENPDFAEARLLTAEALLAQGQAVAAREMVQTLLPAATPVPSVVAPDAYASVAAMALLGRSALSEGHDAVGLRWSQAAAGQARQAGFLCAAAQIEDRIDVLLRFAPGGEVVVDGAARADVEAAGAAGDALAPNRSARAGFGSPRGADETRPRAAGDVGQAVAARAARQGTISAASPDTAPAQSHSATVAHPDVERRADAAAGPLRAPPHCSQMRATPPPQARPGLSGECLDAPLPTPVGRRRYS